MVLQRRSQSPRPFPKTRLDFFRVPIRFALVLFLSFLLFSGGSPVEAETFYVDSGAVGVNDGSSWANACTSLADILEAAVSGDRILVAQGVYRPEFDAEGNEPSADPREATFALKGGVELYGGFESGTSPDFGARDPELYGTILTGDLAGDDVTSGDVVISGNGENAYTVVTAVGADVDGTALLDGFVVTAGNADRMSWDCGNYGGGMYCEDASPTVRHCTFRANVAMYGGGMYNLRAAPVLSDVVFRGNRTSSAEGGGIYNNNSPAEIRRGFFSCNHGQNGGGGIFNYNCDPVIENCTFSENTVGNSGYGGGGISNNMADPVITSCLFVRNRAGYASGFGNGGAMKNLSGSAPEISFCMFVENRAYRQGGGIYNSGSGPRLSNCTFEGNWSYQSGGGMANQTNSSPVLTNCTFGGNSMSIYSTSESSPVLTGCTFSGNEFGMRNWNASPKAVNCIFADTYRVIYNTGSSAPVLNHCVVRNGSVGTGTLAEDIFPEGRGVGPLGDHGSVITCGSPGREAVIRTCAIRTGCPAIDNGLEHVMSGDVDLLLSADQRGVTRPQEGGVDIGAYETVQWYTVTVSTDPGGTVSAEPYGVITSTDLTSASKDFTAYDTPEFLFTPEASMDLTGVWVDGVSRDFDADGATVVLDPLTAECGIEATFAVKTFTVTGSVVSGGGVVSPDLSTVEWGHDLYLVISADAYRHVESVTVNGTPLTLSDDLATTVCHLADIRENQVVEVAFAVDTYTLTVGTSGDGTVTPSGGTYVYGTGVEIEARPGAGLVFDGWSGDLDGRANPATIVMTHDMAVTATFRPSEVSVTPDDLVGGIVAGLVDALASVAEGGTITFADDFAGAVLDLDEEFVIDRSVVLLAPDGGLTLRAEGAHRTLSVESGADVTFSGFTISGGDAGEGNGGGILNEGTLTLRRCTVSENRAESGGGIFNRSGSLHLVNCTFWGNEGLWGSAIANAFGGNAAVSSCTVSGNDDIAIFSHVGSPLKIRGSIVAANGKYDLAASEGDFTSGGHNIVGEVAGLEEAFSVEADRVLPGIVSADLFLGVLCDYGGGVGTLALRSGSPALDVGASTDLLGDPVSVDQRGFSRPEGVAADIGAYEAKSYTVTVSCDVGGFVSAEPYGIIASPDRLLASGDFTAFDSPIFLVTPEDSMDIADVLIDGVSQGPEAEIALGPLGDDHILEALFGIKTFNVTGEVSGDAYGVVTVDPSEVEWGGSAEAVVSADAHAHIVSVSVDGEVLEGVAGTSLYTHRFTDVRENHQIRAAFAIDTHVLTVNASGDGSVSLDPEGPVYPFGTEVTLTAVPEVDSRFDGWSGDLGSTVSPATVTVTRDMSVTAVFSPKSFTVTAVARAGGGVSPTSAQVDWGDWLIVTVTPDRGYVISDVVVDGESVGPLTRYTFVNVREEGHRLEARFVPDSGMLHDGGVDDLDFPEGGSSLEGLMDGTASVDLPGTLIGGDFEGVTSDDVEGMDFSAVDSDDLAGLLPDGDHDGNYLTGTSFDIDAESSLLPDGVGVLPVDLTLLIPESDLSTPCLGAIEASESEKGLVSAFLGEVEILKVTGGRAYVLAEVVSDADGNADDFFAMGRNGEGDFLVGLKFLIADAPAGEVPAVQAVIASGDCRFLVFDGEKDGHFVDPVVAVEKTSSGYGGGGGCSAFPLSGLALLFLPLVALLKGRSL